jgi:hypothetical protein
VGQLDNLIEFQTHLQAVSLGIATIAPLNYQKALSQKTLNKQSKFDL